MFAVGDRVRLTTWRMELLKKELAEVKRGVPPPWLLYDENTRGIVREADRWDYLMVEVDGVSYCWNQESWELCPQEIVTDAYQQALESLK